MKTKTAFSDATGAQLARPLAEPVANFDECINETKRNDVKTPDPAFLIDENAIHIEEE